MLAGRWTEGGVNRPPGCRHHVDHANYIDHHHHVDRVDHLDRHHHVDRNDHLVDRVIRK